MNQLNQIKERLNRKRESIDMTPINGTTLNEFKKDSHSLKKQELQLKLKRALAGEEPKPFTEAELNNYRIEIREGQKVGWYEGIDAEEDIKEAIKLRQEQIDYIRQLNGH